MAFAGDRAAEGTRPRPLHREPQSTGMVGRHTYGVGIAARFVISEVLAVALTGLVARRLLRGERLAFLVFLLLALVSGVLAALVTSFADGPESLFLLAELPTMAITVAATISAALREGRARQAAGKSTAN